MELISIERAASLLNVSQATLRLWDNSGDLPAVKTEGGHRRYRLSDIEARLGGALPMNHYFFVHQNNGNVPLKGISLWIGNSKNACEIHAVEIFLGFTQDNLIEKMEMFALGILDLGSFLEEKLSPFMNFSLDQDVLKQIQQQKLPLHHGITRCTSLIDVASYSQYLYGTNSDRSKITLATPNFIETMDLPTVRLPCVKAVQSNVDAGWVQRYFIHASVKLPREVALKYHK